MSQPGTVPRSRPSRRVTPPAPLRVASRRLTGADTAAADAADVHPAAPAAATAPRRETDEPDTGSVSTVVGLAAGDRDAVADLAAVPAARTSADTSADTSDAVALAVRADTAPVPVPAPLDDRPARGGPWSRLAALVTGRRRVGGRHRPGEVPVRGWSMFAPSRRRGGRRRGAPPR